MGHSRPVLRACSEQERDGKSSRPPLNRRGRDARGGGRSKLTSGSSRSHLTAFGRVWRRAGGVVCPDTGGVSRASSLPTGGRYEHHQLAARRRDRASGGLRRGRRCELALRRGRRRAADRSAARLPGVLVRLAAADRAARGGGFPGGRPRHAWLQPVIEARGLRGLRRRPARRRHPRPHRRARCRVRAGGRSRLGRKHRLDGRDEPPRGRRPARHPQRGPSAAAFGGTAPPEPAAEVLVLLLLRNTGTARGRRAGQRLALLPALPARREPAVHARRRSNATSRRGPSQGRRPG